MRALSLSFIIARSLLSYTANDLGTFRRVAYYVDKVLTGAKPSDLPVEQSTKFELVINLKTAKQIGLTIPQSERFYLRWQRTCGMRVVALPKYQRT
jgi:ABC-type uncharacterized transport system substrate-binding protein